MELLTIHDVLYNLYVQILKEEITPTLTRLKEERSSYLEYQKVIRELEHLNKLVIAAKFIHAEVYNFYFINKVLYCSRMYSIGTFTCVPWFSYFQLIFTKC